MKKIISTIVNFIAFVKANLFISTLLAIFCSFIAAIAFACAEYFTASKNSFFVALSFAIVYLLLTLFRDDN